MDAYAAICKQIEREDNLYGNRFNAWVVFNLALAAASATQIQSDEKTVTHFLAFVSSCMFAIVMAYIINQLLESGNRQLTYLHEQYHAGVSDGSFQGLPRPFAEDSLHNEKFAPRGWSQIPFYVLVSWVVALVAGLIIMCPRGTCVNGVL